MGTVIAIAGKGGTGKSTLGAALIHGLVRAGDGPVLAIDADHNASLALMLGLQVDQTISDIRDQTRQAAGAVQDGDFHLLRGPHQGKHQGRGQGQTRQGCGPQGGFVQAAAGVLKPSPVPPQHLVVGQKPVGKEDGLGPLQVGVAGEDMEGFQVPFRRRHQNPL